MVMCDIIALNFGQYLSGIGQLLDSYTESTIYGILHRYNSVVLSICPCEIRTMQDISNDCNSRVSILMR